MIRIIKAFIAIALVAFLSLIAPSLAFFQVSPSPQNPQGAVVTLDGKPLFTVQVKSLSSSPERRAQTIKDRITAFAEDSSIPIDSLWTKDIEDSILVGAGDKILVYVSDQDAKIAGSASHFCNEHKYLDPII
jgi:hypothetical protein